VEGFPDGSADRSRRHADRAGGAEAVDAQFVRILLTADSDSAAAGQTDVRDRLGYAVRELSIGYTNGEFVDHVKHDASQDQTMMVTSRRIRGTAPSTSTRTTSTRASSGRSQVD
jgi:hypothetical protein